MAMTNTQFSEMSVHNQTRHLYDQLDEIGYSGFDGGPDKNDPPNAEQMEGARGLLSLIKTILTNEISTAPHTGYVSLNVLLSIIVFGQPEISQEAKFTLDNCEEGTPAGARMVARIQELIN